MKIALGQINTHLGDFESNSKCILDFSRKANQELLADLIVFPELSLLGYAPYDLLNQKKLYKDHEKTLKKLTKNLPADIGVLIGGLYKENQNLFNAAYFIHENKIKSIYKKELLPSYDVFFDKRHFKSGSIKNNILKFKGKKLLISICEDIWGSENKSYDYDPINKLKNKVDYLINLSASPYTKTKNARRKKIIKNLSKKLNCKSIYVNQVGAQDELIFDGNSFAFDEKGKLTQNLKSFSQDLALSNGPFKKQTKTSKSETLFKALTLGLKDYFNKSGFNKAHLGLSGGIDSALVYVLACEALGPKNVMGIALPGPYSSKLSFNLAAKLSENLNSGFSSFSITESYKSFLKDYEQSFEKKSFGLMNENLQARLRALSLMAYSNQNKSLLLATSNKSELCVGYSTLYGDQCGALMPIGDLLKTEVFELCKWYNSFKGSEVIPEKIISRPPSAELRPNQKDSDSLPSYNELDAAIEKVITLEKPPKTKLEKWVLERSYQTEFKRWQACPILKVSERAFGRGRIMPLAHKYK